MADKSYIEETEGKITNSMLSAFMECEYYFYHLYITKRIQQEENDNFVYGSAFDCYLTDQKKFKEKYEIVARRSKGAEKVQLTTNMGEMLPKALAEFKSQPLFNFDPKKSGNLENERIEVEYKGEILSYKPDFLDREDKDGPLLSDIKTTASLDTFEKWIPKYKMQLTFGQFVLQMKEDILVRGTLQAVTKEDPPRSAFFLATKESLMDNRGNLLTQLDRLIMAKKSGIYKSCGKRNECPAYGFDPCTIQKQFIYI